MNRPEALLSESDAQRSRRRRWTLCACLGGFLLLVGIAIPVISSFVLYDSFQKLEALEAPTPKELESDEVILGFAFLSGMLVGAVGVSLLLLSVLKLGRGDFKAPRVSE